MYVVDYDWEKELEKVNDQRVNETSDDSDFDV